MRSRLVALACLAGSLASFGPSAFAKATVGEPAPAVEPSKWFNTPADTTWAKLKGRVILVEKWATW